MNDAGTLPRHMLDVRELTAEAFAPYGQVIAPGDFGAGSRGGYQSAKNRALRCACETAFPRLCRNRMRALALVSLGEAQS